MPKPKKSKSEENISQLIWLYVKRRPFIKESLREGLINYSSLSRKICFELYGNENKFGAIKMALQRIALKLSKKEEDAEAKILQILKGSSLNIETKISVIISRGELEKIKPISSAKSRGYVTYILKEKQAGKFKTQKKIKSIERNLNLITIISSEELEETPGFVSLILGALASEGINVKEIISCFTDTLIVVKESDTSKAYEILNGILK